MKSTGPAEPSGGRGEKVYRAAFIVGLAAYGALFAGGIAYTVKAKGRLPAVGAHPLTQAEELRERGDIARAAAQYRMAALVDRTDTMALARAADLEQKIGQGGGQVELYTRQRDLQPYNPATHRNLAQALFAAGRYDEAVASYERAIHLAPADARAYAGIGDVRLEQDRLAEAGQAYGQALQRDAHNAALHNSLGIVAALSHRTADAVQHFEEAVRLVPGPYDANLQRARAELAAAGQPR